MYWTGVALFLAICRHTLCNDEPQPLQASTTKKYLIYDANPGEGFNLRRDVYMRAANLVRHLREVEPWILVLPPWPRLPHWRSNFEQENIPWRMFFDLDSLNEHVPCIEYEDFLTEYGHEIDRILYLQNYAEGWTSETWEDKIDPRVCIEDVPYIKDSNNQWKRSYGSIFLELRSKQFQCMSVQGFASIMTSQLLNRSNESAVLVDRFEQLLHDDFWGDDYWNESLESSEESRNQAKIPQDFESRRKPIVIGILITPTIILLPQARKSMVYAQHLRDEGNQFMKDKFDYSPDSGKGRQKLFTPGPFLAVHLRRADYHYARPNDIPSIEGAAQQLKKLKKETGLKYVFLASDANNEERKALKKLVKNLVWYKPQNRHVYGDGGVAIIDQWICAHASYFIGSYESTFSFRIREDRQLLGMTQEDTFNDICGIKDNENDPHSCEKPSYWHREGPSM